jgi:hypothetical protein
MHAIVKWNSSGKGFLSVVALRLGSHHAGFACGAFDSFDQSSNPFVPFLKFCFAMFQDRPIMA